MKPQLARAYAEVKTALVSANHAREILANGIFEMQVDPEGNQRALSLLLLPQLTTKDRVNV